MIVMIVNEIKKPVKSDNGIVVDLDNVLLDDKNKKNKARFCNIKKIKLYLEENYYNPIILIAGASLRHKINNVKALEKSIKNKEVFLSPALEDNDWFILKYAQKYDYDIMTNDKYKEFWPEFGKTWVLNKRKTFMFINSEFIGKINQN